MLPIRCFSCNKVLGRYNEIYEKYKKMNKLNEFFEKYDIKRYCCRKIFLTHIDIYKYAPEFPHDNIICKSNNETIMILKAD